MLNRVGVTHECGGQLYVSKCHASPRCTAKKYSQTSSSRNRAA